MSRTPASIHPAHPRVSRLSAPPPPRPAAPPGPAKRPPHPPESTWPPFRPSAALAAPAPARHAGPCRGQRRTVIASASALVAATAIAALGLRWLTADLPAPAAALLTDILADERARLPAFGEGSVRGGMGSPMLSPWIDDSLRPIAPPDA